MFCGCLTGHKDGFSEPDIVTHGIGECCWDWALGWMKVDSRG